MNDIVSPEIEDAAEAGLLELNLASSPSQPSRIEWARNRRLPIVCRAGRDDRKKGPAHAPTAIETELI